MSKAKIHLLPGDEFATQNPMALGAAINLVQWVKAVDNESVYTHAGLITSKNGDTLEALWSVKSQNVSAYQGQRILIARNLAMSEAVYRAGYEKIERHIGQWYPFHRLLLHMIGLSKFVHWGRVVCSELTAKFEAGCAEFLGEESFGFLRNWYGVNPDNLADRWRESRHYEVVFEGVLEKPETGLPVRQAGVKP